MAAPTAKVRGTFKNATGAVRVGITVKFEPLSTPFSSGGDIVTSVVVSAITDNNGQIGYNPEVTLVGGSYRVIVSDIDAFGISLPGDGATHNLEDITIDLGAEGVSNQFRSGLSVSEVDNVTDSGFTVTKSRVGDVTETRTRIAFFGEGYFNDAALESFYHLFLAQSVDELVVLGNMNPGGLAGTIDANIGQWFYDYIYPYGGAYGPSAATANHFWYALGSEDWIPGDTSAVTNYFAFPNNERYYKKSINANVALFVIDSNALEPDGNTSTSTQATWLQSQLGTATERYKIVVFRDSPKASKDGYSFTAMNWPFASWGASAVIAAGVKFVERITIDGGIPLYVAGGAWHNSVADTIGTPITGSQFRHNTSPAMLMLDVNDYSVKAYFVNTAGQVLDLQETVLGSSNKIKHSVRIQSNAGVKTSSSGIAVDFGSANGQAIGGTSNYILLNEGRIIRLDELPTESDVNQNPWLKNCLILLGDNPTTGVYYWCRHLGDWAIFTAPDSADPPYMAGALPQLTPPVFTPASGTATGTVVSHPEPDVTIFTSINGGIFTALGYPTIDRIFFGTRPGPKWVAAYARKSGYIDSDVATAQFTF